MRKSFAGKETVESAESYKTRGTYLQYYLALHIYSIYSQVIKSLMKVIIMELLSCTLKL